MESNLLMRSLVLALVVAGCTSEGTAPADGVRGGQIGEEDGSFCVEVGRTPLALDEVANNGVKPQDLVDAAVGEHGATLTWVTGGETALAVVVSNPRDAALVEYESDGDGTGGDLGGYCQPAVEITVDIGVTTDDGALAESYTSALALEVPGPVTWWHSLDAPSGTFDPADYAPTPYDVVHAMIRVSFGEEAISGKIDGRGESFEPPADTATDGSASATMFDIATF